MIALTRQTFVSKEMSLLFHMLSRLVITFLLRSKCLLISWLQSPPAVILEPPKIKSLTVSTVSPSVSHEVMVPDVMVLACHAPCSPLCPKDCSNLCPSNWLCYLTISSSTAPLLLLPSVFPSIRVGFLSQLFASGGQSIRASASVLPE